MPVSDESTLEGEHLAPVGALLVTVADHDRVVLADQSARPHTILAAA